MVNHGSLDHHRSVGPELKHDFKYVIKLIKNNVTLNKPSSYNHFSGQISCQNLDIIRTIADPTFQFIFSGLKRVRQTQTPVQNHSQIQPKLFALPICAHNGLFFVEKCSWESFGIIFGISLIFSEKSICYKKLSKLPNRQKMPKIPNQNFTQSADFGENNKLFKNMNYKLSYCLKRITLHELLWWLWFEVTFLRFWKIAKKENWKS